MKKKKFKKWKNIKHDNKQQLEKSYIKFKKQSYDSLHRGDFKMKYVKKKQIAIICWKQKHWSWLIFELFYVVYSTF
jgi:hypothetical protein